MPHDECGIFVSIKAKGIKTINHNWFNFVNN